MLAIPKRLTDKDSWHGHIPFAFWCIEALAPRVLVELGCQKGDSYCAFCQAVEEVAAGTRCFAVDTWKGDPHAGFYGDEVLEQLRQYHDPRYGDFSTLLQSTFDQAVDRFADGTIDILHIDGAHSYEDVRRDFMTWLPKVSSHGAVLLHDTEVREHGFGVYRLWEEVRQGYPSFSFRHSNGLGVLAVGATLPEPLRRLTSLDEEESEQVRRLFCHLGDTLRLQRAHEALANRMYSLEMDKATRQLKAAWQGEHGATWRKHMAEWERKQRAAWHEQEAAWRAERAAIHRREMSLEASLRETTAALRFRERQVDALMVAQESLLRSTSWRLTSPLRLVGKLLRRIRAQH
jgi:hypothetical protein